MAEKNSTCSIEGCERPRRKRTYCEMHYSRFRAHGDPMLGARPVPRQCKIDGCDRIATSLDMCDLHYQRHKRGADLYAPVRASVHSVPCADPSCDRPSAARGFCHSHYSAAWRSGKLRALTPTDACTVDGCDRPHHGNGLCKQHYNRRRLGMPDWDVRKPRVSVSPVGERKVARNGYMTVKLESGKWELEHRLVMESHLGRPLIDAENVHHINGDRLDNRLKNLELWSDRQPKGQRVDDKIEFALEILRLYKPESLSA